MYAVLLEPDLLCTVDPTVNARSHWRAAPRAADVSDKVVHAGESSSSRDTTTDTQQQTGREKLDAWTFRWTHRLPNKLEFKLSVKTFLLCDSLWEWAAPAENRTTRGHSISMTTI